MLRRRERPTSTHHWSSRALLGRAAGVVAGRDQQRRDALGGGGRPQNLAPRGKQDASHRHLDSYRGGLPSGAAKCLLSPRETRGACRAWS
jgi:hypothetical protein